MINPVTRRYEVCRRTLTTTYIHEANINGHKLCAAICVPHLEQRGNTVGHIDQELRRQLVDHITQELYKDAQ